MTSFLYRMDAGIPGTITRFAAGATVQPELLDASAPFSAYGLPAKMGSGGRAAPVGTGDGAITEIYGLYVRPYPASNQNTTDGLGTSTPPQTNDIGDFLRRGYMMVKLGGATAAAKQGQVYIRVAAAATGKPIGGFEAAADSTNTIAPVGLRFTGPADANGNVEVELNI